jgi:hypothetical protein
LEDAVEVAIGRTTIGCYAHASGRWRAWNSSGILIGLFATRDAARRAIAESIAGDGSKL